VFDIASVSADLIREFYTFTLCAGSQKPMGSLLYTMKQAN